MQETHATADLDNPPFPSPCAESSDMQSTARRRDSFAKPDNPQPPSSSSQVAYRQQPPSAPGRILYAWQRPSQPALFPRHTPPALPDSNPSNPVLRVDQLIIPLLPLIERSTRES